MGQARTSRSSTAVASRRNDGGHKPGRGEAEDPTSLPFVTGRNSRNVISRSTRESRSRFHGNSRGALLLQVLPREPARETPTPRRPSHRPPGRRMSATSRGRCSSPSWLRTWSRRSSTAPNRSPHSRATKAGRRAAAALGRAADDARRRGARKRSQARRSPPTNRSRQRRQAARGGLAAERPTR